MSSYPQTVERVCTTGTSEEPAMGFNSTAGIPSREHPHGQHGHFSASMTVFLASLMTLLVFATVLGNALVILAFTVEKSLRTGGNFFFLNLAIADFLVGGFCIPVYMPYVLTGRWRFGKGLCKLWLVVDYMLCTASVFNIVLISFDRFMSVTKAVSYRCQKGVTRGVVLKMLSVWLAAFLLYGPAIIFWEHAAGESVVPEGECHAEFFFNWFFLMMASTFEFFTPFVSVTFFNVSICLNIRRRNLMRMKEMSGNEVGLSPAEGREYEMEELRRDGGEGVSGVGQRVFYTRSINAEMRSVRISEATISKPTKCFILPSAKVTVIVNHGKCRAAPRPKKSCSSVQVEEMVAQSPPNSHPTQYLPPALHQDHQHRPHGGPSSVRSDTATASSCRLSRDKKVAKSLAVIVCVFGLCWAPYTLLMIIRAACQAQCVQHYLYEISFWLLWINSSINPVLYPLCHTSFRRAFRKLLCPTRFKIQPHYMEPKC